MRVLGISGLFSTQREEYPPDVHPAFFHDAAACLVEDGRVLAAVEEERVCRDKHTNRFPLGAVEECLTIAGRDLGEIDAIAYFFDDGFTDREFQQLGLERSDLPLRRCRDLIVDRLSDRFTKVPAVDDVFGVTHHESHAASTFYHSGFDPALVVVMDGNGEDESITIFEGRDRRLRRLHSYPRSASLGHFYTAITRFVGYSDFDEYKVMGLASYGDRDRLVNLFDDVFSLRPDGGYDLDVAGLPRLLIERGVTPRRSGEPIEQSHRDFAAAGQAVLETIAHHVVTHWVWQTGLRNLCLAGGVSQNTSLNGKLLMSGLFTGVYVHPAPHDAGAAMGAALLAGQRAGDRQVAPLSDVYLGRHIGTDEDIERELDRWAGFVTWERPDDLPGHVAGLLAEGEVVGWAQGRAEFGPRALGSRSILADPRPAENRDRVNLLVKQRESYRPFAPVVTAEAAARYFDLPAARADYGYMGFIVAVREQWRSELAAITHVDGTARVQVLRPGINPKVERLLAAFGALTGVEVLLNTSFNNYAEPIVHTPADALTCLLTTGLSALAVGPFLVRRVPGAVEAGLATLHVSLMPLCEVVTTWSANGRATVIRRTVDKRRSQPISDRMAGLVIAGGRIGDLDLAPDEAAELGAELLRLWDRRLIRVAPAEGGAD